MPLVHLVHFLSVFTAFVRGGASVPNRPLGEGCLSGTSSLAILIRCGGGGTLETLL